MEEKMKKNILKILALSIILGSSFISMGCTSDTYSTNQDSFSLLQEYNSSQEIQNEENSSLQAPIYIKTSSYSYLYKENGTWEIEVEFSYSEPDRRFTKNMGMELTFYSTDLNPLFSVWNYKSATKNTVFFDEDGNYFTMRFKIPKEYNDEIDEIGYFSPTDYKPGIQIAFSVGTTEEEKERIRSEANANNPNIEVVENYESIEVE